MARVVMNRVDQNAWYGKTIQGVCRKPWQFSAWAKSDPNRPRMERVTAGNADFRECLYAAVAVVQGFAPDPTKGATHYHTKAVAPSRSYGKRPVVTIGAHRFYTDVN